MNTSNTKEKMEKIIKYFKEELSHMQVGRASTNMIEGVNVYIEAWGMEQKLNNLANISILDSQTIKIQAWDKTTVSSIEKAIYNSDLGLTPINQGDGIIINVPPLTGERRKELSKVVGTMGEKTKISIRNVRKDSMQEIKNEFEEKLISEDEKKDFEKQIDNLTKDYNQLVDKYVKIKSDEILSL
ncbi:ribosome recycling factor [Candidatus Vampirococcus lugosii]|uniref:Ribosome-recycling factor n=1 Tax=Candidatus Vampirococcus lugosii TaxID=2789015 RepID=A0ABS5QMV9_9BACT|nr:ribosome recycling factor [Candidatus Vampirococcus lugosii]